MSFSSSSTPCSLAVCECAHMVECVNVAYVRVDMQISMQVCRGAWLFSTAVNSRQNSAERKWHNASLVTNGSQNVRALGAGGGRPCGSCRKKENRNEESRLLQQVRRSAEGQGEAKQGVEMLAYSL